MLTALAFCNKIFKTTCFFRRNVIEYSSWIMLKSKIYLNRKHRLGCPSRVKIEDEKLKNADVAERQTR